MLVIKKNKTDLLGLNDCDCMDVYISMRCENNPYYRSYRSISTRRKQEPKYIRVAKFGRL